MAGDQIPSRYPYLISVRGGRPVPARKDGSFYVCAYETFLGLWWSRREVTELEYDPHRDFYREQRQAYLDAHPEAAKAPATAAHPTPVKPEPTPAASPDLTDEAPVLWERVSSRRWPAPRHPGTPGQRRRPSPEWGGDRGRRR